VPRPTIINIPAFKDSNEVAFTGKKPDTIKSTSKEDKRVSVTGRDSRISTAYKDALARFRGRQYGEAIAILQWLLQQYPTDTLASNCEYWIGESYFDMSDYKNAYAAFKRVTLYNGTAKRNDAIVMMKRAAVKQRPTGRTKGVA
jgi:TolA-binding protein